MAKAPAWLGISDAVDEILKRQRAGAAPQPAPVQSHPGQAQPGDDTGVEYGALYAPPPNDLAELRRQQAEFARTTQDLDRQNWWMAIPALAPFALPAADAIAALGLRATAGAVLPKKPLDLSELEPWQRNSRRPGEPLDLKAKKALWNRARKTIARTDGVQASELGAQVHHSEPLELAHLKPGPTRTAARTCGLCRQKHTPSRPVNGEPSTARSTEERQARPRS